MKNKDITLVILAAGMGSRFGGLKQITPMGPNGEFIIDYSIYDAIRAGITKVVFLIKKENEEIFKETIGKRVEQHIKVEYAFQTNDNLPKKYLNNEIIKNRVKPLGTAHAILCCKDVVNEPFMIVNADDFYGYDAYKKAVEFLRKDKDDNEFGMVGYEAINTITENGAVKRGVCGIENNYLNSIIECSIEKIDNKLLATPLDEDIKPFNIDNNTLVSMNMSLFTPKIFEFIEEDFEKFLDKENDKGTLDKCEYLIPEVIEHKIVSNKATCYVTKTTATWYGVTYKEDAPYVKESLKKLVETNEYPNNLWS